MKTSRLLGGAALACGALVLVPPPAFAAWDTPPDPTLTVTSVFSGFLFLRDDTVSFSGADYCGDTVHTVIDPRPGVIAPVSITCGHTVFIGLWEPGPSGGGFWTQSVTVQSTAGGFRVVQGDVGLISGSFSVYCGGGNTELYAYDLDEGTLITGASVPGFACPRLIPIKAEATESTPDAAETAP